MSNPAYNKYKDTNMQKEVMLLSCLKDLALRQHYYCDDCWYTCPKHPEGSCNDLVGLECNCGADKHNQEVEKIYNELINMEY